MIIDMKLYRRKVRKFPLFPVGNNIINFYQKVGTVPLIIAHDAVSDKITDAQTRH